MVNLGDNAVRHSPHRGPLCGPDVHAVMGAPFPKGEVAHQLALRIGGEYLPFNGHDKGQRFLCSKERLVNRNVLYRSFRLLGGGITSDILI